MADVAIQGASAAAVAADAVGTCACHPPHPHALTVYYNSICLFGMACFLPRADSLSQTRVHSALFCAWPQHPCPCTEAQLSTAATDGFKQD
jgi:hypothetical protein